jgi:hypothetical protein
VSKLNLILLLLLIICQPPSALGSDNDRLNNDQKQVLQGSVQDFGIFSGSTDNEDGLRVTSVEEESLVYLIKPGKAKTAHLESGDQILSAKLRENELEIVIERKGKRLKAHIILQGDQDYKHTFTERLKDAIKQARKHTHSTHTTDNHKLD